MASLAEYNNNPGNIRPPKGLTYEGQIGIDDNGFAIFKDKEAGRNALIQDIRAKQKQGLNTPHSFIDKYTPAMPENSEDARDNYKIKMAQHLGLKSTTEPFPEKSEEKIADLIASVESGQPVTQATEEEPKKEPFVPVADTFGPQEETKEETKEPAKPENVVSPTVGAVTGAVASTVGQVPFKADLQNAKRAPELTAFEEAVAKAERRANIARDRLEARVSSAMPITGGTDLPTLEAEYRRSQMLLQQADQELQAATAAQRARVTPTPSAGAQNAPQAAPAAPASPIITDPNAPVTRTATEQMMQGTIDPETGTTGRQRQNYNEVTSFHKLQREQQEKALTGARAAGATPDIGESERLRFGMPDATPSGIIVKPEVAAPLKQQAELEQRMANEAAAQERLAQQQEMTRLQNERRMAAQSHSEASTRLNQAQRSRTSGISRAQNAAETAADKAWAAQQDLDAARESARSAPNAINRAVQNTGVAVGKGSKLIKGPLGAYGGYEAAKGINTLANMSLADLQKRYDAGDRSPALMDALGKAAEAATQIGFGTAAAVPAIGATGAKIKGAGVLGTAGLGALEFYRALNKRAIQRRDNQ